MAQRLNIKDLENLSGIKAHTIRIWEKRYNLFDPERSATNIRSYSNEDLRKLLNVVTIMDSGKRISQICSMSEETMCTEIETIQISHGDQRIQVEINNLIYATLNCDSELFNQVFKENQLRNGLEGSIENLIYPLLRKIGLMWTVSKLNPSQEHFASQLIRQKLFAAIDSLPKPSNSSQKWMLFLPENESHEITLLYSYYLIKKANKHVLYLGPNLPLRDAKECAERIGASHLLCFFTIGNTSKLKQNYIASMGEIFADKQVYYSGISEKNKQGLSSNFHCLENISDLRMLL